MIGLRADRCGLPYLLVEALADADVQRARGVGTTVVRGQRRDAPAYEVRVTGVPAGSELERCLMEIPGVCCEGPGAWRWTSPECASPLEAAS